MSLSDLVSKVAPKQLFSDERALWGQEVTKPMFGALVRVQRICVVREDKPVIFERVMGRADEFPTAIRTVNFPAFLLYSAGEVNEQLDVLREARPPDNREPTDLMGEYLKQEDEKEALKARRTVVGPSLFVQRS